MPCCPVTLRTVHVAPLSEETMTPPVPVQILVRDVDRSVGRDLDVAVDRRSSPASVQAGTPGPKVNPPSQLMAQNDVAFDCEQ